MNKINAIITGVGGYVPQYILNNDELSRMVDTTDEWIMTRIGVKERHILKPEEGRGTSFLATKAAQNLLEKTGCDPDSIEAVIVTTSTPDYHFPSTASLVLGNLGLNNAYAMDFQAACCGFLYTMDIASSMIQSGRYKKIMVIGADQMSAVADYTDRATCPIFGDGAGAVLVEPTTEDLGWKDSYFRCDGKGLPHLCIPAGGSAMGTTQETLDQRKHYLYQEGRVVFKFAVTNMSDSTALIAERNGLNKDNIAWIIPHQANVRIIEAVANRLEVPMEKVMLDIQNYGNTSAGTLPLALWDYEKQLKKGDNLIFTAFGAGFVWGSAYMKWGYDGK